MTTPEEPLPPPPSPLPPPSPAAPIGGGRSVALGCGGFLLFWVAFAVLGSAFASSVPVGVVVLVAAIVGVVALVRGGDQRRRAVMARLAIGFAVAAVIFGGCIVAISNTNFH